MSIRSNSVTLSFGVHRNCKASAFGIVQRQQINTIWEKSICTRIHRECQDVVENVVGKAHDDVETPSDVVENVVENKDNVVENILESISKDPSISTKELAGTYSLSERQVQRIMTRLKEKGLIRRVGPDKGGHWEIIKS